MKFMQHNIEWNI